MGVKSRRVENYYKELLSPEKYPGNNAEKQALQQDSNANSSTDSVCLPRKWQGQIEKVGASMSSY